MSPPRAATDRPGGKPSRGDRSRTEECHLLPRHRKGDTTAFTELMDLYRSPVFSYLIRSGIPEREREDLFQDIFLRIHRSATRYQPSRPLHPWIFTIAANAVRNYWRSQRVRDLISGEPPLDVIDTAPLGSVVAEGRQTVSFLERRIAQLPRPQREVLLLVSVEGLSLKETAMALGTPLNTVKTRLHRARLALVQELGARDGAEAKA
ncbi:MAG: RNA polymerase sigma factor [Deltaproteobacteria bacterium]|nr:RNA polymerase sigma factor [Deltaproteobacteria bacterium]